MDDYIDENYGLLYVIILNTIDHLGKFDRKADDGFFFGYSLNSKAFRVFNSRARFGEENLHVRFSENTPNNVGIGIFEDSHNDEDVFGAEADFYNLDSTFQEDGIDYDEVFAPVARIEAIRLFLAYASFKDFIVYQMDVKSEFLYGKIKEEVNVCQPPRFEYPDFLDKVYKVKKALYGLHQAPRAWYETLSAYLLDNGFKRGQIGITLFMKRKKGDILLVQVYIDDIIFGSTKKKMCDAFEILMHKKFQMSSMDVKKASTPMETSKPLLKDEDGEEVDAHMYRSMIGSIMYPTSSRQDIMFAVCACARNQVTPKVSHLHAVQRIFRYLKSLPNLGFWYPKDSSFDLVAYTDSDYARASLDRKSTTRRCQFLGCRLISWQCKKQTMVANSTTEAKYVAASSCCGQTTLKIKTVNDDVRLQALIDGKWVVINEASIRYDLKLNDAEGTSCLSNAIIFEELARMRVESLTINETIMDNEESSKQGRKITDAEVNLENVYNLDLAHEETVLSMHDVDVQSKRIDSGVKEVAEEIVKVMKIAKIIVDEFSTTGGELNAANEELVSAAPTNITIAQPSEATKTTIEITTAPKAKGIVFHDKEESTTRTAYSKSQAKDKGKAKLVEEPKILKSRKAQIAIDEEVARRIETEWNADMKSNIDWNEVVEQVQSR
uniref:Uncharacterized protein n=1 Tax=Tanacetum cinerariifolium TaxID=118510 RepID=A0A6L2KL17_TANCI|nr:hypothetical protein [Tanacetum cinerariifolium]